MEEHKPMITTCEEDQHMVAAAQHILKALASSKTVSHELRKTLLDLEIQLSTINERKGSGIKQLERKLKCLEDKVVMLRLEEELVQILVNHKQYFEVD
ncbi:exocyst complex component EXO70B1-like, partial [Trifolium medium]|nr:exocyst complex component EXO70B1-like [Trifolium medium]